MAAASLVGRELEVALLEQRLRDLGDGGGALLIRGEAGIGKTALLARAAADAEARGYRVLRIAGVPSETNLPYAGLHQLLRGVLDTASTLPGPQRSALMAAFGMVDAPPPSVFLVGLAVLTLLSDLAAEAPLVVVADDIRWLDGPTVDVLAFVGRRLDSDPVLLLTAMREGTGQPLIDSGLPTLALGALDDHGSARLLDLTAAELPHAARMRILREAAGNPLALVELPLVVGRSRTGGRAGSSRPNGPVPLTARLEEAFASRTDRLPAATRAALLVAAVDDGDAVPEVLAATAGLTGSGVTSDVFRPAIAAGLITADGPRLAFRHPLMRSGIEQRASAVERMAAHGALASTITDDPDRRAWHRAASIAGTDDEIARELEGASRRAQARGAPAVALAGMERAASLSSDPAHRASRLLGAAEIAFELGQPGTVRRLVVEAEHHGLDERDRCRATWLRDSFDDADRPDGSAVRGPVAAVGRLVDAADRALEGGDVDLALRLLGAAALRCWWSDPDPATRRTVLDAVERLAGGAWGIGRAEPRVLEIEGLVGAIDRFQAVAAGAASALATGVDGGTARVIGFAAHTVGDFERSMELLTLAIPVLRTEGRLGPLAQSLVVRGWDEIHLGRLADAARDLDEGRRLATETEQAVWRAGAGIGQGLLAGVAGDEAVAADLAADADAVLIPAGLSNLLAVNQLARGLTALTAGRYSEAFDQLRRMFDPADIAYDEMELFAAVGYLAEAAIHAGRGAEAQVLMPVLEQVGRRTGAPSLHAGLRIARALLAADADAEPLFLAALEADPGWPFDAARLRLAFGGWLRRHRRITQSRPYLRAARDTFEALGVEPWADRARQELRASGERIAGRRTAAAMAPLSPQERQIAAMAAEGLSNREIGERLFLSHRTVASHLYRIFPKLGVASRAELRLALEQTEAARS